MSLKKFLELKRGDGGGENKNASLKEKKMFCRRLAKICSKASTILLVWFDILMIVFSLSFWLKKMSESTLEKQLIHQQRVTIY